MYTPERAFAEKYEQAEAPLTSEEEAAYEKYVPRWRAAEPKLEDFRGIYNDIEIQSDKKFVEERRRQEKEKHDRAQLFEAFLFHALDQEEWLGERAHVARTSEFDDRVNGTDLVVEFMGDDGEVRRLAVDVTVTANIDTLRAKVQKIRENLEAGRLVNLKYFESELPNKEKAAKGGVRDLPRVIVGIEPGSLKEIIKSPPQQEILEEIRLQLEEELADVDKFAPPERRGTLRSAISEVLEEIRTVESQKEKIPSRTLQGDRTAHLLSNRLEEIWPEN